MKKTKTSRKKVAFTLAEVLITIGIIGIVAAITLPTLHTKITKVVLKNQIKKAMSQVNQGYKMALDEVGSIYDGKTNNSYGDFNKAFLNTFKLARICNGNGLKNNCVPEYEGLNVSGCLPFADNQVYNYRKIYITLSGVILISYDLDVGSLWLIDVNGMKGPNKAGWDLFLIDLGKETRPIWSGSNCINQGKIKGSITSSDMSFKTLADW
jgi:type II secretory pathway pseudopilin PulG